MARLERDFFSSDTLVVARNLLGTVLVRRFGERRVSGRIVEVEAYIGETDQASHARFGPTKRNATMFGPPGHAYVYLIYGVHHCLNVVTDQEGFPAAVLIRALEPREGIGEMRTQRSGRPDVHLTNGPGKLCQALRIDKRLDKADLCSPEAELFLETGSRIDDDVVVRGPRIGVRGDELAVTVPWRFCVSGSEYLSR
jgi:DNA-3-methyladenine glycosylase